MAKTVKAREIPKDPNISGFLGIGEGKVTRAKMEAEVAVENAKRLTLVTQANLAAKGYDPAGEALAADSANSKTTMYIAIGVVLVLMAGLYFIIKAIKR